MERRSFCLLLVQVIGNQRLERSSKKRSTEMEIKRVGSQPSGKGPAGGPIEEIRPGDVVWFAPREKHWHGASPTTGMAHIAIQEKKDGKVVDWMEHVTDEQYRSASPMRSVE
jgi:hypothetical protein